MPSSTFFWGERDTLYIDHDSSTNIEPTIIESDAIPARHGFHLIGIVFVPSLQSRKHVCHGKIFKVPRTLEELLKHKLLNGGRRLN